MKKLFALILAICMLLSMAACSEYEISISVKPINPTEAPATEPPITEPSVTEPLATEPSVTEPLVTEPLVTEPPVTEPPVTEPSVPGEETKPVIDSVSIDKAKVDEMNEYLSAYVAGRPEDFGSVKKCLYENGCMENDFIPLSNGYGFYWYAEENVIVLVDNQYQVIYPNAYKGIDASDVRLFFDLSLPVAASNPVPQFTVTADINPAPVKVSGFSSYGIDAASIVVKYDFTAPTEYSEYYNDWIMDFYLSCDLPEGVSKVDIGLVGAYEGNYYWYPAVLKNFSEGKTLALWGDLFENAPTFAEFQRSIRTLSGAIVDPKIHAEHFEQMFGDGYDDSAGATLNVELRLTNPDDSTDYVVVGTYRYTF